MKRWDVPDVPTGPFQPTPPKSMARRLGTVAQDTMHKAAAAVSPNAAALRFGAGKLADGVAGVVASAVARNRSPTPVPPVQYRDTTLTEEVAQALAAGSRLRGSIFAQNDAEQRMRRRSGEK